MLPLHFHLDKITQDSEQEDWFKDFKSETENISRVEICWNRNLISLVPWVKDYFSKDLQSSCKSANKSSAFRNDGNKFFQKKEYREALEFYTKGVLHAPHDGRELSLGFANRSAALFHLKEYKLCLDDIKHALNRGYPETLQYKLYQRRGQCFLQQSRAEEAKQVLAKALELVEKATGLSSERQELVKKEIQTLLDGVPNGPSPCPLAEQPKCAPNVTYGSSDIITQATKAVELRCEKEQGRHLVALDEIKMGDTLIVERPFAAVLLPSHYNTLCHHCYRQVLAPISCDMCTEVRYCSEDCKTKSWETYHRYECGCLDLLHSIGIAHLSMRIVLTAGYQYLIGNKDDYLPTKSGMPGLTADGAYSFGYPSVYHLMPHLENMQIEDQFQYTLTATLLLKCLLNCQFFPQDTMETTPQSESLTGDQLFIGGLLLRHIQQLVCNAHAITALKPETGLGGSDVETVSQVRIATAIYPTASLMNHSCNPNIISSFHNDVLVVRATRGIQPGDQVYNCYGPHYQKMDFKERQQILKDQYFFTCKCEPCSKKKDTPFNQALKCPKCSGALSLPKPAMVCEDCGHKSSDSVNMLEKVLQAHNIFVSGMEKMEKNDIDGAIRELKDCQQLRESVMYRYNKDLAEVHDQLARCYATAENYTEAAKHLKKSLEIAEKIFGSESIELGNELHKYAQILFLSHQVKEAKAAIERALYILSVQYGEVHPLVQELMEMETCLLQLDSEEIDKQPGT